MLFTSVWWPETSVLRSEAVRVGTGERRVIAQNGLYARYLTSGHLLFQREDANVVAPGPPPRLLV